MSGINFLCQSLGLKIFVGMRGDKFSIFHLCIVKISSDEIVHKNKNLGKIDDSVYDIEIETHDFIGGFPLIVHITDSSVLSVKAKDVIRDLKNLEDIFDFSNLNENHELFSNKNKKL